MDGTEALEGWISGYASLFGAADLYGDVVEPGAFARTLAERGAGGVRLLWQHDPKEPIGVWERLHEDARGLRAEGRLALEVARAREAWALLRAGAIAGLSIGYNTVAAEHDPETGHRRLIEVDLWEVSLVTFPACPGATIDAARGHDPIAALNESLKRAVLALTA
jgi:hypothetical protein